MDSGPLAPRGVGVNNAIHTKWIPDSAYVWKLPENAHHHQTHGIRIGQRTLWAGCWRHEDRVERTVDRTIDQGREGGESTHGVAVGIGGVGHVEADAAESGVHDGTCWTIDSLCDE